MHSRSVLCMTGHYNFYYVYVCMYMYVQPDIPQIFGPRLLCQTVAHLSTCSDFLKKPSYRVFTCAMLESTGISCGRVSVHLFVCLSVRPSVNLYVTSRCFT